MKDCMYVCGNVRVCICAHVCCYTIFNPPLKTHVHTNTGYSSESICDCLYTIFTSIYMKTTMAAPQV